MNTTDRRSIGAADVSACSRRERRRSPPRPRRLGGAPRYGRQPGIADLKTVVTEACMNVVVHAYPDDEPGLLAVEATAEHRRPDRGRPRLRHGASGRGPRSNRPSLRIGLTLIAALSASFEINGGVDRGTEIRMHLPLRRPRRQRRARAGLEEAPIRAEATALRVGPPELVGADPQPCPGRPRRPPRDHRRPPLRRDAAQRRDLRRRRRRASPTATSRSASPTAQRASSCGSAR